ncbi:MAG: orotidine 5'-phosphate decarboxylase [Candidatus Aenigmarchaeota archaeon]|nr:orotidine 5'-phosphate decarboxylase [Candidatus Aenigmarchaeota archaeon]
MTKLQVALDVLSIEKALEIAKKCSGAHIFEAGTPLIKSEGIRAITELKKNFPDKIIVADMKTMDTGYLETEIAAKAKADVVSVLAAADDNTIKDAVKAGKDYGIKICCDLINVKDPVRRAKELVKLGVDYLSLHLGIDQQKKSKYPYPTLRKLCEEVKIPVSACGGLTDKDVANVINAGADIIIIGSFITKSKDPSQTTKLVLEKMILW